MKTFVSLNLDNEHPSESGVVVFQAESKEDAVMAVALEILDEGEIEDYEENVEEGEDILEYINMWIYDDYPVMIAELKGDILEYVPSKVLDFETWYSSDLVPLFENKFKK